MSRAMVSRDCLTYSKPGLSLESLRGFPVFRLERLKLMRWLFPNVLAGSRLYEKPRPNGLTIEDSGDSS